MLSILGSPVSIHSPRHPPHPPRFQGVVFAVSGYSMKGSGLPFPRAPLDSDFLACRIICGLGIFVAFVGMSYDQSWRAFPIFLFHPSLSVQSAHSHHDADSILGKKLQAYFVCTRFPHVILIIYALFSLGLFRGTARRILVNIFPDLDIYSCS